MKAADLQETVTVEADAPLLNTTNAEVGVLFDTKRVTELPISPDRNIFGLALSAPGVSQLGSGSLQEQRNGRGDSPVEREPSSGSIRASARR